MAFFHPLHALLVLEVAVFLYQIDRRPRRPGLDAGFKHLGVSCAIILAAFVRTVWTASDGAGVEVLFGALTGATVTFALFALIPLFAADLLRRKRREELRLGFGRNEGEGSSFGETTVP